MQAERRLGARRAGVVLASVALLASSCTGGSGPPVRREPTLRLEGTLLVGTIGGSFAGATIQRGFSTHVASYSLAKRRPSPLAGRVTDRFPDVAGAKWGPDGTAYVLRGQIIFRAGIIFPGTRAYVFRSQLFAIDPQGGSKSLGPSLRGGELVAVTRKLIVASACLGRSPGVYALDLVAAQRWRLVARGCQAAVSPDGASVAYGPRTGAAVWTKPVDGRGAGTKILDISRITPELRTAGIRNPQLFQLAWGLPGVAAVIGNNTSDNGPFALVIVPESGSRRPLVIPLGRTASGVVVAWQPGGDLLGVEDCTDCTSAFARFAEPRGELRTVNGRTGEVRQIAAAAETFDGMVWSPDGQVLAAKWQSHQTLFVRADGAATTTLPLSSVPLDWRA